MQPKAMVIDHSLEYSEGRVMDGNILTSRCFSVKTEAELERSMYAGNFALAGENDLR